MPEPPAVTEVTGLDQLGPPEAADALAPCCASRRWGALVVRGRPYGSLPRLVDGSDRALALLDWADVQEALAAHPRIGARTGDAWSAQEQQGAAGAGAAAGDQLREANAAYEQRFGHVFLICATGRSAEQMLARLHERLGHDTAAERQVVRAELREIVTLRLAKAFR